MLIKIPSQPTFLKLARKLLIKNYGTVKNEDVNAKNTVVACFSSVTQLDNSPLHSFPISGMIGD